MSQQVTIVMYHYVRPLERSRFPALKALSVERFARQLDHIVAAYHPVTVEQILESLRSPGYELPPRSILLTFDDGYSDHFQHVFPHLDSRGIQGCFFPPVEAVLHHKVLDVNKIQFTLAAYPDPYALLNDVLSLLDEYRSEYELESVDDYRDRAREVHRYDSATVIAFKRLLQRELPEPVRRDIVNRLFQKYVTRDEAAFASELYMTPEQMSCMIRHGMHFGCHGYSHAWMDQLTTEAQSHEVDQSLGLLVKLGCAGKGWTMCYPYGGYNASLLKMLQDRGCQLGFSVEPRIADLAAENPLTLPRIDTNDLPS